MIRRFFLNLLPAPLLAWFIKRSNDENDEDDAWTPSAYEPMPPLPPPVLPAGIPVLGTKYQDEFGRVFVWVQVKGQVEIKEGHMLMKSDLYVS